MYAGAEFRGVLPGSFAGGVLPCFPGGVVLPGEFCSI